MTRADFYIGIGPDAEWLGSIACDGYPEGNPSEFSLFAADSEAAYRKAVADMLAREDGTTPEHGWPWPWEDSRTTDYAYCYMRDREPGPHDSCAAMAALPCRVDAYCFGHGPFDPTATPPKTEDGEEDEDWQMRGPKTDKFPDMAARKRVTLGPRSGLLVFADPEAPR